MVYVKRDPAFLSPVAVGCSLTVNIAGHTFWGACKSFTPTISSKGTSTTIELVDNREFLDWDVIYGAFNMYDDNGRNVSGNRVRRYWHIFPREFGLHLKTFTTYPLSAAQIIHVILYASTVEDPWAPFYHPDQAYPVYQIDCMSGKKLKAVLAEISERQGLLFALYGGPWSLVWARKGEGPVPVIPAGSEDRVNGLSLSGNPTRIRVLGDRNVYQVHDIRCWRDWNYGWEIFFDVALFEDYIYRNAKTTEEIRIKGPEAASDAVFPKGTVFSAIGADLKGPDPEQLVARQAAKAYALQITVREFVALKNSLLANSGNPFIDTRMFSGRSRMDMPCALYIQQLLFRAFRLSREGETFSLKNADGFNIPLHSLVVRSKLIAKVDHDPITGAMSWDYSEATDGNGYAIVKGYQVGKDLFKTIKPERFDIDKWHDVLQIWEHIEFQIDDSGAEDGAYLLFDEPVVNSGDLIVEKDGYACFKANPSLTVPEVRVALCFEAERFSYVKPLGRFSARDEVENVSGLNAELLTSHLYGGMVQVPFLDGQTAAQKADVIANSLLSRQFAFGKGSYVNYPLPDSEGVFPVGTQLTAMIDRITVNISPSGCTERVELTTEKARRVYIPERDLDRGAQMKTLLPGQAELKQSVAYARLLGSALRTSPKTAKTLTAAFKEIFGGNGATTDTVVVAGGTTGETLPVGSVLRKNPNKAVTQQGKTVVTQTTAVIPSQAGAGNAGVNPAIMNEVIRIAETGASVAALIAYINSTTESYQIGADQIIYLHEYGIPDEVITALVSHGKAVVHAEFAGVTVRDGEVVPPTGAELQVQKYGDILARVRGPVKFGDKVGLVDLQNFLAKNSALGDVGVALQEITTSAVKLIKIRTGAPGKPSEVSGSKQFWLWQIKAEYFICMPYTTQEAKNQTIDPADPKLVKIAKVFPLRRSTWDGQNLDGWEYASIEGDDGTYIKRVGTEVATGKKMKQYVVGIYHPYDLIYADKPEGGTGVFDKTLDTSVGQVDSQTWIEVEWLEKSAGQYWTRMKDQS